MKACRTQGDFRLFVCSFVLPSVCPPQALLGLKSALSGLESVFSGLESALSGLKHVFSGLNLPSPIQGLRGQISGLWGQISGLRGQISGLRGPGGTDGWTDKQQTNKSPPVDFIPISATSLLPLILIHNHAKQGNGYRWPHIALGRLVALLLLPHLPRLDCRVSGLVQLDDPRWTNGRT